MTRIVAVIVNYLAPGRTARAARALLEGDRPPDALVIVDNGGADEATLRATLPAGATVVATPTNLGFAGGANAGLRAALAAGAEAVLFVNDDATLARDALGLLERALDEPGVGVVAPALLRDRDGERGRVESLGLSFVPWSGRLREVARGARYATIAADAPHEVDAVSGCVALVRREVLEATGGFDPGYFFYFEDLDLCLRARRAGWRVVVVPRAVALHEGSASLGAASTQRLYHAVRGHLRLGASLGGAVTPLRQALIVGWNVAHALRYRRLGAVRAVLRGALDHARGQALSEDARAPSDGA